MSQHWKALSRGLLAVAAATACLLASAVPAAAQVSIVPDQVAGGGTQTFAFRFADERKDTKAVRLELLFPPDTPIAFVQVDPAAGWNAHIRSRPVDPPVRLGDQTVSQVADALVFDGGAVAPGEFEQFLVTMGPLPVDGRIVFEATQNFADGTSQHWASIPGQGPAIAIGSGAAAGAAPAGAAAASPDAGYVEAEPGEPAAAKETAPDSGPPLLVLWVALGVAVIVIAVVGLRARHRRKEVDA